MPEWLKIVVLALFNSREKEGAVDSKGREETVVVRTGEGFLSEYLPCKL
jgi:hypothetical protein